MTHLSRLSLVSLIALSFAMPAVAQALGTRLDTVPISGPPGSVTASVVTALASLRSTPPPA